jgi:hypothetical protein
MPVHGRDDIAGDNPSLGRGAICLWLGDKCTPSSLLAETLCDVGSDRLNLKADPTAANKPLVLKLSNALRTLRALPRDILQACRGAFGHSIFGKGARPRIVRCNGGSDTPTA